MNWTYLLILVLSTLLFVGGPDGYTNSIIQQFWNVGHLLLFACIVYFALLPFLLKNKSWLLAFCLVTVFCLGVGISIEAIQHVIGRTYDTKDVVNDLYGGYLGLLIYIALHSTATSTVTRFATIPFIVVILAIVLSPLVTAIEYRLAMEKAFPVLADFETSDEWTRWETNLADVYVDEKRMRTGKKSMLVEFKPGEYPTISLTDFPRDWEGFDSLDFSIFNPTALTTNIILKIYDRQHTKSGYSYSDRFNRELTLQAGWNDFSILLKELQSAPKDRLMELSDIASYSLFFHNLQKPTRISLDSLQLSNKNN